MALPLEASPGPGELPAGEVELAVFFLVGLLGGAHCLGMCGPLVTMYAERMTGGGRDDVLAPVEVRQHALFNLGRTVSYAVIGGLAGLAGMLVYEAASTAAAVGTGVRAVTGVVVGALILVAGARYVLGGQGGHGLLGGGPFGRVYGWLSTHVESWVDGPGIFGLGLVHGLLPCPLLYPAFLYAFARGSPTAGAAGLAALGLGTFPTLFLYGTVVGAVSPAHRRRLHRALGVAFLLLGWMPLAHGLHLLGIHVPHVEVPIYQPLG